ncbi:MAG: hypothetical protein ACK41O_27030, partial [Runella zeae]
MHVKAYFIQIRSSLTDPRAMYGGQESSESCHLRCFYSVCVCVCVCVCSVFLLAAQRRKFELHIISPTRIPGLNAPETAFGARERLVALDSVSTLVTYLQNLKPRLQVLPPSDFFF